MASYNAEIPESLQIESEVLKVNAKSFADYEIRWDLLFKKTFKIWVSATKFQVKELM